jgi:hypothetical protein
LFLSWIFIFQIFLLSSTGKSDEMSTSYMEATQNFPFSCRFH